MNLAKARKHWLFSKPAPHLFGAGRDLERYLFFDNFQASAVRPPVLFPLPAEQGENAVDYRALRGFQQLAHTARYERYVGRKELTRTCVADMVQRARREVRIAEADRIGIGIRITCDLTKNVIPRPTSANTTAGRSLLAERSEKGKVTNTTERTAGVPMPHPPPDGSNPCLAPPH